MLFNSASFGIFLIIVFAFYWTLGKKLQLQNLLLLIASYFFYAWWDWRFLLLLTFSTSLDFYTGLRIAGAKTITAKKFWLWLSILVNVGFLWFFKYYNFFAVSFAEAMQYIGVNVGLSTLKIILPVGISFYTFHGLSYIIDIYKNKIRPERNFVDYAIFVSFFPLLIAGPIERATHLLPQIKISRTFDYQTAVDGLKQILWGLFKKVVIADRCALYVNDVFNAPGQYTGSSHVVAAVFFAIQIYCDFSAYSDIAIGVAKVLGIRLIRNFSFPYFSRNIAEFWRRWHISLSSWFRDYLYIPLGGSRTSTWKKIRNVSIVFLVSGFWHGANWTFIAWGLLNALYILPSVLLKTNRQNLNTVAEGKLLPTLKDVLNIGLTFGLTTFAWIFFRSETIGKAFSFISKIFSASVISKPVTPSGALLLLVLILFVLEWIGREQEYAIAKCANTLPKPLRWATYYLLVFLILYYSGTPQQFIYFEF